MSADGIAVGLFANQTKSDPVISLQVVTQQDGRGFEVVDNDVQVSVVVEVGMNGSAGVGLEISAAVLRDVIKPSRVTLVEYVAFVVVSQGEARLDGRCRREK